jgi:hypothetical protein
MLCSGIVVVPAAEPLEFEESAGTARTSSTPRGLLHLEKIFETGEAYLTKAGNELVRFQRDKPSANCLDWVEIRNGSRRDIVNYMEEAHLEAT